MKKTCLITGGAGFLGKKYCEFFLKNDYLVFCIDNNKKLQSLRSLKDYFENFKIYECDITSNKKVEKLFKSINKSYFVMY